jgi:hypothetical protein
VGFEPTDPVFERAKTVHALDRTASMIGILGTYLKEIQNNSGKTTQNFNNTQTEIRHWTGYCASSIHFTVHIVID